MPQETQAMAEARKRFVKERAKADQAEYGKWVSENMGQLYQWAEEFCGAVINIRPSYRFIGEEFTGDFISKAFRKYSENRPGKKTGKKLNEYNEIRENSLKNADGKHSDELATEIANKY